MRKILKCKDCKNGLINYEKEILSCFECNGTGEIIDDNE